MQDERNSPQEEDEVEAHKRMPAAPQEPGQSALDEDDDEVEAHRKMPGSPSEYRVPDQSE